VFTQTCHWILSWGSSVQYIPSYPTYYKIYCSVILPYRPNSSSGLFILEVPRPKCAFPFRRSKYCSPRFVLNHRPSLSSQRKVSHPTKTTCEIIVLHSLMWQDMAMNQKVKTRLYHASKIYVIGIELSGATVCIVYWPFRSRGLVMEVTNGREGKLNERLCFEPGDSWSQLREFVLCSHILSVCKKMSSLVLIYCQNVKGIAKLLNWSILTWILWWHFHYNASPGCRKRAMYQSERVD
jgi:hypothetical protein